jgi:hypothetical protein
MPFNLTIKSQISDGLYESSGTCVAESNGQVHESPVEILVKQNEDLSLLLHLDSSIKDSTFGDKSILFVFHEPMASKKKVKEGQKLVFEKVSFNVKTK